LGNGDKLETVVLLWYQTSDETGRNPASRSSKEDMKGYILRDKEVEDEAKKARKAKNQGEWIAGRCEPQECGELKWIRPKFIPGPGA
jgi:hypothetical protein